LILVVIADADHSKATPSTPPLPCFDNPFDTLTPVNIPSFQLTGTVMV